MTREPTIQQMTQKSLKSPRSLIGTRQKKGNPDCAIILFGIIRHCEHNFHPFPEKSTASIPCTFASFASQNCHYWSCSLCITAPSLEKFFFLGEGLAVHRLLIMQPFFLPLDQCYRHFDVTKSMFCLLIVTFIGPGSHRKRPSTLRVCAFLARFHVPKMASPSILLYNI